MTPPLHIFAFFMIPFYMFIKDEQKLRRMNDVYCKFMFVPSALCLTVIFSVANLLLVPFAYLAAIFKKIKLLRDRKDYTKRKIKESDTTVSDLAKFILLGIPMLLMSVGKDAYIFLTLTYREDVKEYGDECEKEHCLTE